MISVRNGGSVNRLRKAAVLDRLDARPAQQLRRRHRTRQKLEIDRHADASRHREAVGRVIPGRKCRPRGQRYFKALIDQPKLALAENIGNDQSGGLVAALHQDDREARIAHGLEHECLVGARRELADLA